MGISYHDNSFLWGLQLVMLGIIGIYLGKVFKQVKDRPLFIIRSKILNDSIKF